MLNKMQKAAVNSSADKILCLAGAGTGKTYTMLHRIMRLADDGVDPSSILVLTFTNAAAFNMRTRFKGDVKPEFRTFHAFCYSLIASNFHIRSKLGYSTIPRIADEVEVKNIKSKARMVCNCKLPERKLNDPSKLTDDEKFQYSVYYKYVRKQLIAKNMITFNMLCRSICNMFIYNDDCVKQYKDKYKYIFVDEFQDTDKLQWNFVSSFSDAKLFLVGDALQSLYAFRGADSSIIKSLSDDPEWEVIKMGHNYRSTDQICKFANANTEYADNSYKVEIYSTTPGTDPIVVYQPKSKYSGHVLDSELRECESFVNDMSGSSAILCRTNAEVDYIVSHLNEKGISVSTKSKIDAKNMLKSALDDEFFLNWMESTLSANIHAQYIRDKYLDSPENELQYFIDKYMNLYSISYIVKTVSYIRVELHSDHSNEDKFYRISSGIGQPNLIMDDNDAVTDDSDIVSLILDKLDMDSSNGVYVGTIHSVKGLEFDNVLLVGVNGPSFRLNGEDNNNLYYVGITRAKTILKVLFHKEDK